MKYFKDVDVRVYDFAVGGHCVPGVERQITRQFEDGLSAKPEWARWSAHDTLFITWVGINDCAFKRDPEESFLELFAAQEILYTAGARNFLFIDVPPMDRTAGTRNIELVKQLIENWNAHLARALGEFHATHPDISAQCWSMV